MRTLKQEWAFERCFKNKGGLAGIITRLNQIATDRSTHSLEGIQLLDAANIVSNILNNWNDFPEESWRAFEHRSRNYHESRLTSED